MLLAAGHPVRARQQGHKAMRISVVIPVLHEAEHINDILTSLQVISNGRPYETIVVDGDPAGGTIRHIKDSRLVTLIAQKGRARQMNAGAARATGEILLFLHADTLLPVDALAKIEKALSDESYVGGAFNLDIQNNRWIFQIIGRCASWKHRLTRVPYGDQAIFIRRRIFKTLGGYPEIPLMEDVELMKRIKRKGWRIIILPDAVKTSSRKWEKDGVIYTIFRNWTLQVLYLLGMPAGRLVRYYYKECQEQ